MIYASSKDAIKKKFTGIKQEWRVNGLDDTKDRSTLVDKLGGSVVVSLEGKTLQNNSQVPFDLKRLTFLSPAQSTVIVLGSVFCVFPLH